MKKKVTKTELIEGILIRNRHLKHAQKEIEEVISRLSNLSASLKCYWGTAPTKKG